MNEPAAATLTIAARFCGPPDSGNGGYVCGLVAKGLPGAVAVTLRAPPPLDTPLILQQERDHVRLMYGDAEIAVAQAADLALEPPLAPSYAQAVAGSRNFAGFHKHPLPGCFVCGPQRAQGDGLRVFAGRAGERNIAAAPWTPEAQYADGNGRIAPEFVWAVLDCPGYFGLLQPDLVALLGWMHCEIMRCPRPGEDCVIAGWSAGSDGRKHRAGTALYDAAGNVLAKAAAVWIELDRARFRAVSGA